MGSGGTSLNHHPFGVCSTRPRGDGSVSMIRQKLRPRERFLLVLAIIGNIDTVASLCEKVYVIAQILF